MSEIYASALGTWRVTRGRQPMVRQNGVPTRTLVCAAQKAEQCERNKNLIHDGEIAFRRRRSTELRWTNAQSGENKY